MDGTHLIDGAAGTPHISALDVRTHNATLFGDGIYITDGLDGLPITVTDANTLTIGRGCMLVNGARITQENLLKLTIESGQQGVNRNDLLVGTYTYDGANTRLEDVNFEIITGTPTSSTAKDPTIHSGTLLDINGADLVDGVSTVQFPIARIPITGITVGTPVVLAKKFTSVESLQDSVSPERFSPSIINISGGELNFFKIGNVAICNFHNAELGTYIQKRYGINISRNMPKPPVGYEAHATMSVTMNDSAKLSTLSIAVGPDGVMSAVNTGNVDIANGDKFSGSLVYVLV